VIVCKDPDAARRKFGVHGGAFGLCYTRTGRPFFDDPRLELAFMTRLRTALDEAGAWEEFQTQWICLDTELMPWSVKAQALLKEQYAAVGAASARALSETTTALRQAAGRGLDVSDLQHAFAERTELSRRFVDAYRRYCWPVHSVDDLKLAPFHLLATEGKVHADRDHAWHMETLQKICETDPGFLVATPFRQVDLLDEASQAEATRWWEEMTSQGGEGMVVKPLEFVTRGHRGLVQPAMKCRGPEYLRIIYGPEYTLPANLERLRSRGLSAKRSLALREFALGIEGLERFVRGEPLRRVHECVFGVLALESEPVDPRL
jgi:protein phosphatase